MKHLHLLFETLEVPIYVLIIGILTFKANVALSVLLIAISLFRLWINVTFKK